MSRTVLVVDDEPQIRKMLRSCLGRHDCRVLEASDGDEAFAMARREKPDLVIMDVKMPRIEGVSAAHVLRETPATAAIPILIYTGREEEEVRRTLAFGPSLRYLSKTAALEQLWAAAWSLMSSAGAR